MAHMKSETQTFIDLTNLMFSKDAHQQVDLRIQTPLVPCDGVVSGLHHCRPCTMLEGLLL
jgi:hypothetical protein